MTKIILGYPAMFLVAAAFLIVCGCISSPSTQPVPPTTHVEQTVPSGTQTSAGLTYEEYLRLNPPPPQNVRASLQTDHVSLQWDPPVRVSVLHNYSDTVAYYRIYKGTSEKDLTYFTSSTGPAFNDYNVSANRGYFYQITAVQAGDTESTPAGTVTIQETAMKDDGKEGGLTHEEYRSLSPPAPENLTVVFRIDHIELRWDAPVVASVPHTFSDIVSHYRIYKGTAENNLSYLTSTTGPAFNDFSVSANRRYFYQITAVQQGDLESSAGKIIQVAT
jgi:fibronectin type 3 domain-containing protein